MPHVILYTEDLLQNSLIAYMRFPSIERTMGSEGNFVNLKKYKDFIGHSVGDWESNRESKGTVVGYDFYF